MIAAGGLHVRNDRFGRLRRVGLMIIAFAKRQAPQASASAGSSVARAGSRRGTDSMMHSRAGT